MPNDCPSRAELADFHRGVLPDDAADRLAGHVEGCARCEEVLQGLDSGEDTLPAALRQGGSTATIREGPGGGGPLEGPGPSDTAGMVLAGRFKLVEPIGEGGMGTVWMAQQIEPVRRLVAVKLIKAGMDSRSVLARFEAERQALAMMEHPNIARVFDAGTAPDGRPFFAMELVKGASITRHCDEHRLSTVERLGLFVEVCRAVQHAHQKGVIHRDIKPSNVLIAPYDGAAVPKVIDFGVAKAVGEPLTDGTIVTGFGSVVGTPEYMAPEQAETNQLDVDTWADIYALGVLLYELLTGSTPITRERLRLAALLEVLRLVREEEPPLPSSRLSTAEGLPTIAANRRIEPRRLTALVRGDLDWIAMRALEKDRTRRYETADGLARDIQRYLADEPVEAGPPTARYRLGKFARKHRGPLRAALAVAALLVASAAISAWQAHRARRAEAGAIHEAGKTLRALDRLREEQSRTKAALDLATREEARARDEVKTREDVQAFFLRTVFVAARPKGKMGGLGRDVTLRKAIDASVPQITKMFSDRPRVEKLIRQVLGNTYYELGEFRLGIEQYKIALDLAEAASGPDDLDTLTLVNDLGNSYRMTGQTGLAVEFQKRALNGRMKRLGPDHPTTLLSMVNLAAAYQDAGLVPQAIDLGKRAVAGYKARPGRDDAQRLTAMNNLAVAYWNAGQTEAAIEMSKDVLAGREAKLGHDHDDTLWSRANLGAIYASLGDLDKAIPLHKEVLEVRREKLGPRHRDTITSMVGLANAYKSVDRMREATLLLQEALEGCKENFPPDHPYTIFILQSLAGVHLRAGHAGAALPLFEDALKRQRSRGGPDDPQLGDKLAEIGSLLINSHQAADAVPWLRECLEIRRGREAGSWKVFNAQSLLGGALAAGGDRDEAGRLMLAGYEGMRDLGPKLPEGARSNLPQAARRLLRYYETAGDPDDLARWRAELAKYPAVVPVAPLE